MGEATERIESHLEAAREDLGRNLHELERRASSLTDWRWYYKNRPFAVLGAAFGGAMLLGVLARSRAERSTHWEPESPGFEPMGFEAPRASVRSRVAPHLASSAGRLAEQAGMTWDHIADALLGVAAAKAIQFVGQRIPGFNEEYSKRHGEGTSY